MSHSINVLVYSELGLLFSKGKTCNSICYMETIFTPRTNVIGYRYKKQIFSLIYLTLLSLFNYAQTYIVQYIYFYTELSQFLKYSDEAV